MTISFKERVRVVLIQQAQIYNDRFLNKEYLIHSCKFKYHLFYVIAAKRDNFLHLTGGYCSQKVGQNIKLFLFSILNFKVGKFF